MSKAISIEYKHLKESKYMWLILYIRIDEDFSKIEVLILLKLGAELCSLLLRRVPVPLMYVYIKHKEGSVYTSIS